VFGLEWVARHAAGAGYGGGQIGADDRGCGQHRCQTVSAAQDLEVGKVRGVGS